MKALKEMKGMLIWMFVLVVLNQVRACQMQDGIDDIKEQLKKESRCP